MRIVLMLLMMLGLAQLTGCASAVSQGSNTALDSVDLQNMTDQMARGIAGAPQVREVLQQSGKLTVVVQPVENRLTGEVLPAGQAELFTARVRTLLSQHAPETFTWLMNRDAFYRLQGRERDLDINLGPEPGRLQPEYALTARFTSLTDESSQRRTAAYLCVYSLTSIKSGATLWTDKYEVKKTVVKGFLD
jgi:hypothetical protein